MTQFRNFGAECCNKFCGALSRGISVSTVRWRLTSLTLSPVQRRESQVWSGKLATLTQPFITRTSCSCRRIHFFILRAYFIPLKHFPFYYIRSNITLFAKRGCFHFNETFYILSLWSINYYKII